MKSIAAINMDFPAAERALGYFSGESLQDFDIAIFDPKLPYLDRIQFDAGGSCLSIEAMRAAQNAIDHWHTEIVGALSAGKTVFVLLNESVDDQGAISSTYQKSQRNYATSTLRHYSSIPTPLLVKNAKGTKIVSKHAIAKSLYAVIGDIMEYRVTLTESPGTQMFGTKDGTALGSIIRFEKYSGHLVLLPFFDFDTPNFAEEDDKGEPVWSVEAIRKSKALAAQLAQIDGILRRASNKTPQPHWISEVRFPQEFSRLTKEIKEVSNEIERLQEKKESLQKERETSMSLTGLLYENGKALESAVDEALVLLGYETTSFKDGALEIDHIFASKGGLRMIGETEGKDDSAVDIAKFRQLESNIGKDFERDDVELPAKGVLFGNGFRLTIPALRAEQFTAKCFINARRLHTALVRTQDLYAVAVYLKDRPEDEAFKAQCRAAIEGASGEVVEFPTPPEGD